MNTLLDLPVTIDKGKQAPWSLADHRQNLIVAAIAMLSDEEIQKMDRQDLIDALRMMKSSEPKSGARSIDQMNKSELRRVLAIVRNYLRQQTSEQSDPQKWSPELN